MTRDARADAHRPTRHPAGALLCGALLTAAAPAGASPVAVATYMESVERCISAVDAGANFAAEGYSNPWGDRPPLEDAAWVGNQVWFFDDVQVGQGSNGAGIRPQAPRWCKVSMDGGVDPNAMGVVSDRMRSKWATWVGKREFERRRTRRKAEPGGEIFLIDSKARNGRGCVVSVEFAFVPSRAALDTTIRERLCQPEETQ